MPGEGHDETFWRDFVAALKEIGYAGSLSLEYAGPNADVRQGMAQAVALLRRVSMPDAIVADEGPALSAPERQPKDEGR